VPAPVEEQVMMIFAANNGHLDDIPVEKIRDFESKFLQHIRDKHTGIAMAIKEKKKIEEDTAGNLNRVITEFKKEFNA
jgi:F-type H+-transporting ATPase subunit alpha